MVRKLLVGVCFVALMSLAIAPEAVGQQARLRLAGVFGDHMVLQRERPIPVWGWATPGENVKVTLGEQSVQTKADPKGKWKATLDALPAGGPHKLTVAASQTLTVSDVMIGEVWLCSGQSNMAWTVSRAQNFEQEKKLANLPKIRMMTVVKNSTPEIAEDCQGDWKVASSETVGAFSASAWFFGRKLHEELDVPIGLINSSWGGTDIVAWTSRSAQLENEALAKQVEQWDARVEKYSAQRARKNFEKALSRWEQQKADGKKVGRKPRMATSPAKNQSRPANLFNGMIQPLIPFGMRGVIWYQGERNSKSLENGARYATQLKTMINDWRSRWNIGDFPFITVQLPNFRKVVDAPVQTTGWVLLRESQMKSMELENTGVVITTDVGMANDIHPKNKQAVGHRLALWALGTTYGKDLVYSAPIFQSVEFGGGQATVSFEYTGDGLKVAGDSYQLNGFAVAGEDQVFHVASAAFDASQRKVVVTSDKVKKPVAVRYNWAENPVGNVVNSAGLPMAPFRTDDWAFTESK